MSRQHQLDAARRLFLQANATYHEGDFDRALEGFRAALELDRDMTKARAKAAGLLRVRGKRLAQGGDVEGALGALREGWSWDPTVAKLQALYSGTLRLGAGGAIANGDFEQAGALLEEALLIDPSDREAGRLHALLGALPLEPLESWLGASPAGGQDLIVMERGVDEIAVGAYLRQAGPVEVFADRPLASGELFYAGLRVRPLLALGSVGLPEEVALARDANRLGGELLRALQRELPDELRCSQGLDVLERLSLELDTLVFASAKTVFYLSRVIRSGRFRRIVFVLGDGRLARNLAASARDSVGPGNVHMIWCSRTLRRYDRSGRPLDEREIVAAVASGPLEAPVTLPGDAGVGSPAPTSLRVRLARLRVRTRARRAVRRWRVLVSDALVRHPRGGVVVLPSPSRLHTALLRPVISELARSTPVCVLDISLRRRQRRQYARYRTIEPSRYPVWIERRLAPAVSGARLDPEDETIVERALERLATRPEVTSLQVEGEPLWPVLEPPLAAFLRRRLPTTRRFAEDFERFLDEQRPAAIILGRDRQGIVRVAIALARRRGIPSVTTQPYLVSSHPMWNSLQADVVTVVDDFARSVYLDHLEARPDQVVMTGIPRFDSILEHRAELRSVAEAHERDASRRRTVLLILQRFSAAYTEHLITEVAKSVAPLANVDLVVKMHPSESAGEAQRYRTLLARFGPNDRFSVRDREDLHALMVGSDVVVAVWSTAILEAAMLDRLVLRLNLSGDPMPVPFVEMGVAVGADSEQQLQVLLPRCLDDEAFIAEAAARRHEYLARNTHLLERPAAQQIAALVLRLANEAAQGRASGRNHFGRSTPSADKAATSRST